MGIKKNHARKNKRLSNNWRQIIRMRKGYQAKPPKKEALDHYDINEDVKEISHNRTRKIQNNKSKIYGNEKIDSNFDKDSSRGTITSEENNGEESQIQGSHHTVESTETMQRTEEEEMNKKTDKQSCYVLQKLDPYQHTRIIRGDFHNGHERFSIFSRGKQCAAISVLALCFFEINDNPETWRTADINQILINGDAQYNASYKNLKREGKTPETEGLLISEVSPYAKIGRNFYHVNRPTDAAHLVERHVLSWNNLLLYLNQYFIEHQSHSGVFTCDFVSFAIMRKSQSYFLLNPNAMSYAGEPMNPLDENSSACLLQTFTIECLANHLLVACNKSIDHIINEYDPASLFSISNLAIERKIFGKDISTRKKVTRDLCYTKRKRKPELLEDENVPRKQRRKNDRIIGVGMANLGNSCYLNATLQALFNIDSFAQWLNFGWKHACNTKVDYKNSCIVCAVAHVLQQIESSSRPIEPIQVYSKLKQISPLLKEGQQNDAHEFLKLILESMRKQLKTLKTKDEVSNIFGGLMQSSVKCMSCDTETEKTDDFIELVLNINNVRTLKSALSTFFNTEYVEYVCEACEKEVQATKKFSIKKAPRALCIVLSRFENRLNKIEDPIEIPAEINLSNNTSNVMLSPIKYRLKSIISHIGILEKGHYTTLVCKNEGKSHYQFDDRTVERVSLNNATTANAYIVLYEMIPPISETGNPKDSPIPTSQDLTDRTNEIEDDIENNFDLDIARPHKSQCYDERNLTCFGDEYSNRKTLRNESISNIKSVKYDHNYMQRPENEILIGRRIVDIGYLFQQMKVLFRPRGECELHNMECTKEIQLGLRSIFRFQCRNCGHRESVESCFKSEESMHVNEAATLGITAIGSGFYHLEEFCAHLDIPCMSSPTFATENKKLQKLWWELAKKHTDQALKDETELAKSTNSVDAKGNALIPAEIDGSWAKRSYGKGYSSLSFKNKYCHICKMSYAKNNPPNKHECNINYEGPSTGMEATIIVEGFQSCEKMGARFHKFVGDGDASTYKELRELSIYKDPDIVPEKFECENHLFRNGRSKFGEFNTATKYKPAIRKHVTISKGDEICKGIRIAAKHWRESNIDHVEKLENLERDCLNAPYHCFGVHDNCQDYFCKKKTTTETKEIVDLMKAEGIFQDILNYININFACNAKSLLEGYNTNASEGLNNIIAKNTGGKRLNYVLAGSYKSRCATSVVQLNSKGHVGSAIHKFKNPDSGNLCLKIENARIKKCGINAAKKLVNPRKKIFKDTEKSNTFYGANCGAIDMPERVYETAKKIELARLDEDRLNREVILAETYGQRHNKRWFEVRKKLIHSTYFHRIVNAQSPKSYAKILEEMMYSPMDLAKSADVRHQRLYELEALKIFSSTYKDFEVKKTGLFIDKQLGYLGASPLRLYGDDNVVIVKCPLTPFRKKMDVNEALKANLLPYWKHQKNGNISINLKGSWYIEIQGILHVTDKSFAFLVVSLGEKKLIIERVVRDDKFWVDEMEAKLHFFYYQVMIKEVINSRRARKMELRVYDPKTNTFV